MNEENGRSSLFLLFPNIFFCLACNMVPENWHICVNKGITYLLLLLLLKKGPPVVVRLRLKDGRYNEIRQPAQMHLRKRLGTCNIHEFSRRALAKPAG